jgi:2-methylisocitrate lyase-like PEP mutase family enzyme
MAALGAQAIGTTSAGFAFTLGLPDGARITRDEALAHAEDLVAATRLPVSADLENGYAETPEGVGETIRLAGEAGLAGASIEDTDLPGLGAFWFDLAVDRVRAAVAAARALGRDFVLVARADGLLTGSYDLKEAIARMQAFEQAGADCVYAPLLPDLGAVGQVCAAVRAPVNVLAAGPLSSASRSELAWRAATSGRSPAAPGAPTSTPCSKRAAAPTRTRTDPPPGLVARLARAPVRNLRRRIKLLIYIRIFVRINTFCKLY